MALQQRELEFRQAEVHRIKQEQEILCQEQEHLQAEAEANARKLTQHSTPAEEGGHTPERDKNGETLDY